MAHPVEWLMLVPGQPAPIAVVRRLKLGGRICFRAVTWAKRSDDRSLIGYFADADAAAAAVWQRYIEAHRSQHENAARRNATT